MRKYQELCSPDLKSRRLKLKITLSMQSIFLVGLVFLSTMLGINSLAAAEQKEAILLKNLTIIDGLGTDPLLMRDVLIEDGHISKITVTGMTGALPKGTKVIAGKGLTVMPGLMDLHAHLGSGVDFTKSNLSGDELSTVNGMARYNHGFGYVDSSPEGVEKYFHAFLNAGVTTLLEVGGNQEQSIAWRDSIETGERLGPTLYLSGQTIEALKNTQNSVLDLTSTAARAEIKELIKIKFDAGIRNVKLYAGITPWEARHISNEAHKYGMKVNADFWGANLSREIMEIGGLDSYAHGGILEVSRDDAKWMAKNNKFATMTLSIYESMTGGRVYQDYKTRGFLKNPLIVDVWGKAIVKGYYEGVLSYMEQWNHGEKAMYTVQLWGNKQSFLDLNMRNAKIMWEEGVQIGMGTDSPRYRKYRYFNFTFTLT